MYVIEWVGVWMMLFVKKIFYIIIYVVYIIKLVYIF